MLYLVLICSYSTRIVCGGIARQLRRKLFFSYVRSIFTMKNVRICDPDLAWLPLLGIFLIKVTFETSVRPALITSELSQIRR